MPRQIEDMPITTRTARAKLAPRGRPYYRRLTDALALGYRRAAVPPGVWVVRTRLSNGRYSESKLGIADDLMPANGRDILTFDQAASLALTDGSPDVATITVGQALTEWAERKCAEHDEPKRQQKIRSQAALVAKRVGADVPVGRLTVQDIERFRSGYLVEGGTAEQNRARRSTGNRDLGVLKSALTGAAKRHGIDGPRPWDSVHKFGRVESFGKRTIVLDQAQRAALLDACEPALHDLVKAALATGARPGELLNARCRDVRGRSFDISGKTGRRTMTLSPAAVEFYAGLSAARDGDEPLLRNPTGARWAEGAYIRQFNRAAAQAGLPDDTTLYCARHTYITAHLSAGVPVTALALQTGTSAEQIAQTYANFLQDDRDRWFGLNCI